MKITHYINRPDADDILVDVDVIVLDTDQGIAFSADDIGVVAQHHEKYVIGDEIILTLMEKSECEDIVADRFESRKDEQFCWENEL